MAQVRRSHRPGHDLHPLHHLRPRRPDRRRRPEGARADLPEAGLGRARPAEIWTEPRRSSGRARARPAPSAADIAGHRHHQPARDRPWSGTRAPASRSTTPSSGRTPGPTASSRSSAATAARTASARGGLPLATYFSGPKIALAARQRRRPRERAEAGDMLFGTMDTWVHLEPDRRRRRRHARHRRHQRQPHHADGPRDPGLGRRDPRAHGRPAGDAAGDQVLDRGVRRGAAACCDGVPVAGDPRRPAGGPVRPDLLRRRRGQEHVRHRQLPAAQHRHEPVQSQERPADDRRLQDRRPAGRSTRSRARSPSPARWSSGCATSSA